AMQIVQVEGIAPQEAANSGDFYETQYELLQSRSLAERVADSLNLANSAALDSLMNHSWFERFTSALRPQTREEAEAESEATTDAKGALRDAVDAVQEGLSIEPIRNSRLVKVHFD